MHICPVCVTAVITGVGASIPIITRVYRKLKARLGIKRSKTKKRRL